MRLGLLVGVVGALVAMAGLASGASGAAVPNLNWTALLPALPGPTEPQPGAVPHCRKATVRCVDVEIRRMRRLQQRLGCDHGAVFATTYLVLTRTLRKALREDTVKFRYPRYLFREDALFANVYFDVVKAWRSGEEVPEAWRIAFQAGRDGEINAGQDMLLGINAHVQNDMPFVLAALGLRTRGGESRKVDHDAFNEVLNRAYEPVVRAVERRYDPVMSTTTASWNPVDDLGGLEMVRGWREVVWRNAERLVSAGSAAERAQVAAQIEQHAATWAQLMATPQQPGYRAQRDAYCAERLGG